MKIKLALVAMIGLCGVSHAQVATYAQPEVNVVPHSMSCSSTTSGQPALISLPVGRTHKFYGISGTAGQSVMICKKK